MTPTNSQFNSEMPIPSLQQIRGSIKPKRSDFVLAEYAKSSNWRATYQILNTVLPYILLWLLAVRVLSISLWLEVPVLTLLVLFSLRCFSLMHDCGHYSLFRSRRLNRLMGFFLGVINGIPQYGWSRDHAYHHKTNGDWERYRGVVDVLSTKEFAQLDRFQQRVYEILRHPLMAIPGGFFYLVIKPRIMLIVGVYDFFHYLFSEFATSQDFHWRRVMQAHQSKYWQSADEFWDLVLNNLCVIGGWIGLSYVWGANVFWSIYAIVITASSTIFIWVFFVQHIFEDTYAHKTEGWDYTLGAIEGSSYLELPAILSWFAADIGYHNIHHLSERIPNYHLADCHQANKHLLTTVKTLRISDLFHCAQFILWDDEYNRLVTIASFRENQGLTRESNQ